MAARLILYEFCSLSFPSHQIYMKRLISASFYCWFRSKFDIFCQAMQFIILEPDKTRLFKSLSLLTQKFDSFLLILPVLANKGSYLRGRNVCWNFSSWRFWLAYWILDGFFRSVSSVIRPQLLKISHASCWARSAPIELSSIYQVLIQSLLFPIGSPRVFSIFSYRFENRNCDR